MIMLDLCCGLKGASQPFRSAGWEVVTVDNDERFAPTCHVDLRLWSFWGPRPDIVWASPPCTEFSRESMPWSRTGRKPDLSIVEACLRIIHECDPEFWVLENVRGAVRHLEPLIGRPIKRLGPIYLWGKFPDFTCQVTPYKQKYSGQRPDLRSKIPSCVGKAMLKAIDLAIAGAVT